MTSKKKRKKLKEQYNNKSKIPNKLFLRDRELVLNFLKNHPNEFITAQEIINNNNLEFDNTSGVSRTIKAINYYTNFNIQTKKGKNGGYIYYA
ncbi:MAG: hypothetical protein ACI4OP_07820 [Candidatus Coprovivens sp.]